MVRVIASMDEAIAAVGQELGVSDWRTVDQRAIDTFADVTGDDQWIHVDTERAAAESPYGSTIAHGYLTLSLVAGLAKSVYVVENRKMGINYGLNKVRFLAPVRVGSRVRLRCEMADAQKVSDTTLNITVRHTVELEGSDKPALVAEAITRLVY